MRPLLAGAVAVLLLGIPVSLGAWRFGHVMAEQGLVPDAISRCDRSMLQPGGRLAENRRGCDGLRWGAQLLDFECANTDPRTLFTVDSYIVDSDGDGHGDISGCRIQAPGGEGVELAIPTPPDVAVVVDFTPASDVGEVGLQLRCRPEACLGVVLMLDGSYTVDEFTPSGGWTPMAAGPLNPVLGPAVRLDQPNRMVVSLAGDRVAFYLNGRRVYSGRTRTPVSAGDLDLYQQSPWQSTGSELQLHAIHVYRPA